MESHTCIRLVHQSLFSYKLNNGTEERDRTVKEQAPQDFLTTMAFATFLVCGLDYIFTMAFALGVRVSSLYGAHLSMFPRCWHIKAFTDIPESSYEVSYITLIKKSCVSTNSTTPVLKNLTMLSLSCQKNRTPALIWLPNVSPIEFC